MRIIAALLGLTLIISGCVSGGNSHNLRGSDKKIAQNALDSVNALRMTSGVAPLVYDDQLASAARRHATDMSRQSRPWHFGSDGSSPIDRVYQAGFVGSFLGELISETFENESDTVAAWYSDAPSREILLDENARYLGIGWHQEGNGKIWWTLEIGG